MYTENFSERVDPAGVVHPVSTSTALSTGYVSMANYHRMTAILVVGAIAAGGTLAFKLEQAQDDSGTGLKDITGKAITPLDDTDDDKIFNIELRSEELDTANGFRYVRATVTAATAASLVSVILAGIAPRFAPVPTTNWEEIVD